MGQNTVKAYGSKGRQDLLQFDPEDITLITDEKHPLYDPRVKLPVDEGLVLNVMYHGVIQPISVRKNGERDGKPVIECVVGRQRVKAALEANKRLRAEGLEPIRIPAIIKRGEDYNLYGILISENELRQDDAPIAKARKIQHYLDFGRGEDEAAAVFGVVPATIKNYLALLDCHKIVQTAVEEHKIGAILAVKEFVDAGIPREEQPAVLEKLLASGVTKGEAGIENVRRIRNGAKPETKKQRLRSRKELAKTIKVLVKEEGRDTKLVTATLKWVLGGANPFTSFPGVEKIMCPEDGE